MFWLTLLEQHRSAFDAGLYTLEMGPRAKSNRTPMTSLIKGHIPVKINKQIMTVRNVCI